MKFFVCLNQVPNPYDEFAVESALQLKDKTGAEVIYVSIGGDSNKGLTRKALAMGGDKGISVKSNLVGDSYSAASKIAATLNNSGADIIFFGKQSIDYDNSAICTMVAEMLGLPSEEN